MATHRIPGEFSIRATPGKLHIMFRLSLADQIIAALFLCLFSALLLGHLFLLFSSIYLALRGNFSEAALNLAYGEEKWLHSALFILTLIFISFLVYSLLWWVFGTRELIATRRHLTTQQMLFGKRRKTCFSADDIHYFNQFTTNSEYGDSWQLEAVTSCQSFKLYSHSKRYPVDWIGSTLSDFYNAEFRMLGPSGRRSTRASSVIRL